MINRFRLSSMFFFSATRPRQAGRGCWEERENRRRGRNEKQKQDIKTGKSRQKGNEMKKNQQKRKEGREEESNIKSPRSVQQSVFVAWETVCSLRLQTFEQLLGDVMYIYHPSISITGRTRLLLNLIPVQ